MFEQLLAELVGLVDTLMVSQSGEAAVAGVALVDNINRLIIQVMAALATGGAVVCSQYIGKGRDDESRKSGAQLETVLLIFSVIMTAFSVSFTRPLLKVIFILTLLLPTLLNIAAPALYIPRKGYERAVITKYNTAQSITESSTVPNITLSNGL